MNCVFEMVESFDVFVCLKRWFTALVVYPISVVYKFFSGKSLSLLVCVVGLHSLLWENGFIVYFVLTLKASLEQRWFAANPFSSIPCMNGATTMRPLSTIPALEFPWS